MLKVKLIYVTFPTIWQSQLNRRQWQTPLTNSSKRLHLII